MGKVDHLKWMLAEAGNVVAFTGAGISTESGIPDYRSPGGIWTKMRPIEFGEFLASAEARRESWRRKFASHEMMQTATPNAGHRALARLVEQGKMTAIVTQNIDGLHQKAGTPAEQVIELHGTMFGVVCVSCGDRSPMAEALARIEAGEQDPACGKCGGILKSATVMFGQPLDPVVFARAERAATGCDLFLAIGSTLTVEPAASLCALAAGSGAALVIVNRDPTPYDGLAAEVIREPIGTAVPRLAAQLMQAGTGH